MSFVSQKILSKNFVAILETKPILTLHKPIYEGFSILDLIKLLMHEIHYEYIQRKINADLLFADTGRLIYETRAEDIYENFYKDRCFFDFRDYSRDSNFFVLLIKKLLAK